MLKKKLVLGCCCALLIAVCGCSRQQSDWQKTREANSTDAYEQFVKKYPSGEFAAQAQARLKELYEERDWQKARDADTLDAYQAFLKEYPEGKWTEEARIRVENFTLAQTPAGSSSPAGAPSASATTGGAPSGPDADSAAAGNPAGSAAAGAGPPATRARGALSAPATSSSANAPVPASAKAAKAHASSAHAAAAAPPAGRYAVQLGAFKSGAEAANKRWERLQKEYPKLFAGLSSKVLAKKSASGTLYRLQAVGMTEIHARHICKDLKAKSQPCVIVRPTST